MSLVTSTDFASVSATGSDWRDVSKKVLEQLASVYTGHKEFTLGFLFISDALVDDAESILTLFRSVTKIENWAGSVGIGVFASGAVHIEGPAISAMVARFEPEDFCMFSAEDVSLNESIADIGKWMEYNDPLLTLVHGNPLSETPVLQILSAIEDVTGGFIAGGLASSRDVHYHFNNEVKKEGLSGVAFSARVGVSSFVTQGCTPVGAMHTITRCDEQLIQELDGRRAYDVFVDDLKAMAAKRSGKDLSQIEVENAPADEDDDDNDHSGNGIEVGQTGESDGEEDMHLGEIHVAFPVLGSDQEDYMVRNALGFDPETGTISVAHYVTNTEQILFVQRDSSTIQTELTKALLEIRHRVEKENGQFEPKGALYISCVARVPRGELNENNNEMKLIRDILGDIPLAGYYANGEISNRRLYGYTGVLILFV